MSSRSGVALLLLLAAGCTRQSPAPEQANAPANEITADEVAPAARAPVAAGAVDRSHQGEAAPAARLTGVDGKPTPLAGYRGKPVLVNLWATWCAPCIAEMPTLDDAAKALRGKVAVLAVNQGEPAPKVLAFFERKPFGDLGRALDPEMALSVGLAANLPTTILYDAAGKEVWRVTGPREWNSAESLGLIGEAS